jgi:adenosine deaminase
MHARIALLLLLGTLTFAQAPKRSAALTPERRTAKYFDSIKSDPVKLRAFLHAFPKGGDLHNHLSGAVYAESYIQWAWEMGLCATKDMAIVPAKQKDVCDDPQQQRPVREAQKDAKFYNFLIDALSMRNWNPAREPGEYHFFSTFGKFAAVSNARKGDELAEVMHRTGSENTLYLELTMTIETAPWQNAAKANPWPTEGNVDLGDLHKKMLASGLAEAAGKRSAVLDEMEAHARQVLRCDQKESRDPGCGVTVRYISEIFRLNSPETVFAQFIWGFELAKHDPRVVAVNPVQPEDGLVAMRDYDLHMRMLDYLHKQYPEVHITLHAGELGFGLVPPEELGTHIPKAIDMGHAERIGHGTDIMHYSKPDDLMKEMADKRIAVEISPSSSDLILGIKGTAHPLHDYIKAGVPVVISTDDAGVARSDLTNEYMRAVMESGLSYEELKRISINSIEHAFIKGASMWHKNLPKCDNTKREGQVAPDPQFGPRGITLYAPPNPLDDRSCLLLSSEKAQLQDEFEAAIAKFEDSSIRVIPYGSIILPPAKQ